MPHLVIKDFVGYRLAVYDDYNDAFFQLENGETIGKGQGFIADITNLDRLVTGAPLRPPEELMYLSMPPEDIVEFLDKRDFGIDKDLRIRKRLEAPMLNMKTNQIPFLVIGHRKMCEMMKKKLELTPIHLVTNGKDIGLAMETPEGIGVSPLPPGDDQVVGEFCETPGHQVIMRFGDHCIVIKNSNTGFCQDYVQAQPLNIGSLKELNTRDRFVDIEGVVHTSGAFKLCAVDLSIDGFLKGV